MTKFSFYLNLLLLVSVSISIDSFAVGDGDDDDGQDVVFYSPSPPTSPSPSVSACTVYEQSLSTDSNSKVFASPRYKGYLFHASFDLDSLCRLLGFSAHDASSVEYGVKKFSTRERMNAGGRRRGGRG